MMKTESIVFVQVIPALVREKKKRMTKKEFNITLERTQTLDTMLADILNQSLVAVEAEAGSLMLVAEKRKILQIKARLGKPQPRRKTSPVYKIDDKGIASWVVNHKQPYLCNDVSIDINFLPSRSSEKNKPTFYSLLSVPIIHSNKVIAIINADSEKSGHFTDEHKDRLVDIANQVADAINERISILDALEKIGVELSRLAGEGKVETVLPKIAEAALSSLGANIVTVYEYDQKNDHFLVEGKGPTCAGQINDPGSMKRKVYTKDVPWIVVHERKSDFYSDVAGEEFLSGEVYREGEKLRPRFIEREGIKSMATLLLPYHAFEEKSQEVVGVMFVNYRTRHEFNIDEISALATFADYAAIAILNARHATGLLMEELRKQQVNIIQSLLVTFSHRMSNLAGVGRVNIQLLEQLESIRNDPKARELLDEIEYRSDVLLNLAKRLKRLFDENSPGISIQPLDIIQLVKDERKKIQVRGDKKLYLNSSRNIPTVQSVDFQLREVIFDMLDNALAAIENTPNGQVEVQIAYDQSTCKVDVLISDNGIGMDEALQKKLFKLGTTTKGSLGIGLWWSRISLQTTGGDVRLVKSAPNKGSTFVIELPCSNIPIHQDEVDLLLVDDEETWVHKIIQIVDAVYPIRTADSASAAIQVLKNCKVKTAVLDLRLDDSDPNNKDGLRVLEFINENHMETKVIFISGHASEQDQELISMNPRIVAFLDKNTLNIDKFRQVVKKSMGS
jgi:signal transduction histidine kinase